MCGIVCYFGAAANNLARVLSGMAAITYRAPDSTGIGLPGDDRQPIRTIKSLGDPAALLDKLHRSGLYPDTEYRILTVCQGEISESKARELQHRLLAFESLDSPADADGEFVLYNDLLALGDDPRRLQPGRRGRPAPLQPLHIRSRKELVNAVKRLGADYDVSSVGIYSILRSAIAATLNSTCMRS